MNAVQSARRPRRCTGTRPQTHSDARSKATGAAVAMFLAAVILGGLSVAVEAAWSRAALIACALACLVCGAGLFRASEWARVAGAIVCVGMAFGAILVFHTWTTLFSLGALGSWLALPSTKLALQQVRVRALAHAQEQ